MVDDVIFIARISEPQEVVYSGLFWRRSEIDQTKLTIVVTTMGGYIEVVQRIVETIRHHY
ncbi:hypothetical protein M1N88_00460 [Dehalococcoidia bacterium]|nr:hypothetical protein [Dehalococcoidia bacterium]